MRTSQHILYALTSVILLITLGGCGHPADNDQLIAVDSLLIQNRDEEALQMLQILNTSSFNHNDKAYLALLTTQANLNNHMAQTDDKEIDEAVKYFQAHGDKEKQARGLICQGCVNKQLEICGSLSAYFFKVRVRAARKPARWVPPSIVLILFT